MMNEEISNTEMLMMMKGGSGSLYNPEKVIKHKKTKSDYDTLKVFLSEQATS
jgi:hypothetical protein